MSRIVQLQQRFSGRADLPVMRCEVLGQLLDLGNGDAIVEVPATLLVSGESRFGIQYLLGVDADEEDNTSNGKWKKANAKRP